MATIEPSTAILRALDARPPGASITSIEGRTRKALGYQLDPAEIEAILDELAEQGLAATNGEDLWVITQAGLDECERRRRGT